MKNQKGITLIALVITIIVLLILAGISIAMLTGENGILVRASESNWKTKLASAEDIVNVYIAQEMTEYYNTKYVNGTGGQESIDLAVQKGCEYAGSNLGTDYTVTYTAAQVDAEGDVTVPASVLVVYTAGNGDKYSVKGTVNGSILTWKSPVTGITGE